MCFGGGGGNGNQTTNTNQNSTGYTNLTSQSTYTPAALAAYQGLLGQIQGLGGGVTPEQQQAISQIQGAQGGYQPALATAQGMTTAGAGPVSSGQIQNYLSPYQNDVIKATMEQLGQQFGQQQSQLSGNAALAGALGGNRLGVAQGVLGGQQGLIAANTLAGLNQSNYNQALSAAQADQARMLAGGQQMGGLGALGQQLGLSGSQALYQAGLAPYQNMGLLAGLTTGVGGAMGGTTIGQQQGITSGTQAGTSVTQQNPGMGNYLGMGLGLMGLLLANGGRVHRADGGGLGYLANMGPMQSTAVPPPQLPNAAIAVPSMSMPNMPVMPQQNLAGQVKQGEDMYTLGQKARAGLSKIFDNSGGWGASIEPASSGVVGGLSALGEQLGNLFANGGRAGYDDGGNVFPVATPLPRTPEEMEARRIALQELNAQRNQEESSPTSSLAGIREWWNKPPEPDTSTKLNSFVEPITPVTPAPPPGAPSPSTAPQNGWGAVPEGITPTPVPTFKVNPTQVAPAPAEAANTMPASGLSAMAQPAPASAANLAEPGAEEIAPSAEENHAQTVARVLRQSGMSENGIRGMLANIQDESGFLPGLRHPDQPRYSGEAHYAHGLFQMGGGEWKKYEGWLRDNHPDADWRDPVLQTQFQVENLQKNYPATWKRMNEGTAEQAAQEFLTQYERPAARYRAARAEKYGRGIGSLEDLTSNVPTEQTEPVMNRPSGVGALAGSPPARAEPGGVGSVQQAGGDQGGLLSRLFGVNFLTPSQRQGLIQVGLGMAGNTLSPMAGAAGGYQNYVAQQNADRQAQFEAAKLLLQAQQVQQAKTQFTTIGHDAFGNPQYGFVNSATGQISPAEGAGVGAPSTPTPAPDVHGADFLKSLNPQQASLVQAVGDYRQKMPTGLGRAQQMRFDALVHQYNPDYDSKIFDQRQATMKSFSGSGSDAKEIQAYDTVMGHLTSAYQAVDALGNTRSSVLNAPINAIYGQVSPSFQKAQAQVGTALDRAIDEVNKATTGKAITQGERKEWHERLSTNSSPTTMKETLKEFADLIKSRMDASARKYNNGMGLKEGEKGYVTAESFLSPKSLKQYQALSGEAPAGGGASPAQPIVVSRPNMSSEQLRAAADRKVASGTPRALVAEQMHAWGEQY